MSHDAEPVSRVSPRPAQARPRATWPRAHSVGELVALAALVLSAVALICLLGADDAPGSVSAQVAGLLGRVESRAAVAIAGALCVGSFLAWVLALAIRGRDDAVARADRLARDLATSQRQVERLQSTLEGRDELLLAIVHELRAPLTQVVGYAELLGGDRPRHPDEIGEMNAAIQGASTTMRRLLDDLVEATRAQARGFSLRTRSIDLGPLLRAVVAGYDAQEWAHQVTLDLPDHWLAVRADPERVRQILANLLTNAISYSPAGGEIRVSARPSGDRVRVEVSDHGIGMDDEEQRRAFDRFYRAPGGRALREQGSGLGLAIVRDLVEAHGGEVGLSSQPGVGSTFWFTLPVADDRAAVPERRLTVHTPRPAPRGIRAS